MKIVWQIGENDIQKVRAFCEHHKNNTFVKNRIKRNLNKAIPEISQDIFWKAMISCLLTTQQRSGPNSAVTRFICTNPFPLGYSLCSTQQNIQVFVEDTITNFGGLRRAKTIGKEASANFEWLEKGGWNEIFDIARELQNNQTVQKERESAEFIVDNLRGFGPKQARNLLQSLGLTKYEIPVDSRITKWLNDFGFPIKLSATALADKNYYNFVLDGFQEICKESGIYPCILDAAIFSSFDHEWSEDKLVW
ncbi:MAG: hypothetical protein ACE5IC_08435 [Candidatus Brocadiales bacterium]